MNTSILRTTVAALLIGLAGAASAAVTMVDVALDGTVTVNDVTAPGAGGSATLQIDPSTFPIDAVFIDNNPGSQNPTTIGNLIELAYGLSPTALTLGSECPTASCTLSITGNELSIATLTAFDYLAVHMGGSELFFHWASPINAATLTMITDNLTGGGFSNWRTYSAVPLPGAAFLFLSALGFLGLRRKLSGQPTPA